MSSLPPPSDPYSTITVDEVAFTGSTGPVEAEAVPPFAYGPSLDPENFSTAVDAFVVGIHAVDPPVGSGDPQSRDSLIGFKILATGEYTDIKVPIFPYRPEIRPAQVFPPTPDETTEIVGTLWHDVGSDYGATQGVIQIDGEINAQASITNLDQNPNRDPIGQVPDPELTDWRFSHELGPGTDSGDYDVDPGDDPRFGESVEVEPDLIAENAVVFAGAPLENHSMDVGSVYVLNGIFEEIEPGTFGIDENQIEDGAQFGTSVAGVGLGLAVGAPADDGGKGMVYVIENEEEGVIDTISGNSAGDGLGEAVDMQFIESGGSNLLRVLAGAPNAAGGGEVKVVDIAPPQTGDRDFTRDNTFSLSPDELASGAEFGSSIATPFLVALDETQVLIGAPGAASEGANEAGKAYLYEGVSATASPELSLAQNAAATGNRFGSAVDLTFEEDPDPEGDLLAAVGAPDSDSGRGEAYLFEEPLTDMERTAFSDPGSTSGDELGAAVSLTDAGRVIAGAPGGGYATLFDESFFDGVAGHFTRPGDLPSFGTSVATSSLSPRVAIGAPDANGGGRVYIYGPADLPEPSPT